MKLKLLQKLSDIIIINLCHYYVYMSILVEYERNNDIKNNIFKPESDFVMIMKDNQPMAGGYKIDSILMKTKSVPLKTLDTGKMKFPSYPDDNSIEDDEFNILSGGSKKKFSDSYKDLAIPTGLFIMPMTYITYKDKDKITNHDYKSNYKHLIEEDKERDDVIEDSIFDKLIELVSPENRKKVNNKTRRNRNKNKKTITIETEKS